MLTVTNPVELDQQEVSSFVGALKNLSLGSIVKIALLIVVLVVVHGGETASGLPVTAPCCARCSAAVGW